jgi:hypothetical protein
MQQNPPPTAFALFSNNEGGTHNTQLVRDGPLSAPNPAGRERRLSGDENYLVVSGSSDSRIKETRRN